MLEFRESITLEVPRIQEPTFREFGEAGAPNATKGLIVEVAAIHVGLTKNFNNYNEPSLEESLASWVSPYPRPIILNHDVTNEPIGRVMGAKMDNEEDGSRFIRLQAAVLDPTAIEKVMDQRYLTGSVGGRAQTATCSVCEADWAQATAMSLPCKHGRGQTYKGKLAYIEMGGIQWNEYSFVNVPADKLSGIRAPKLGGNEGEEDSDWVRPAHFFAINMNKEEVVELTESAERNVLGGLKKKEASSFYLSLKGGFLTALADITDEEKLMTSENEEIEDVLAVSEDLSADLSALADREGDAPEEAADEAPANEDEPQEDAEETEEAPAEEDEAPAEEDADETVDEPVEEATRPEGQEKAHTRDVDPHGTPNSAVKATDGSAPPVSREAEDEGDELLEEGSDSELGSDSEALEQRVRELETEVAKLSEENVKLRTAVKRGIAERVVDTRIALGLDEPEVRNELLTEYTDRSVASLADSLRDLARMKPVAVTKVPEVEETFMATDGDTKGEITEAPRASAEDILVDALMGRRPL